MGLVHSSASDSLVGLVLNRLKNVGDVEELISPTFLIRNWPPAFKEWSTKSVRDAFFASPQFPRIVNPDIIKDTIATGVSNHLIAYVDVELDRITYSGTSKNSSFRRNIFIPCQLQNLIARLLTSFSQKLLKTGLILLKI